MNLILLFPEDFISKNKVRLAGERAQHIREILRAYVGRDLKVGVVNGRLGTGRVIRIDPPSVELEVEITQKAPLPSNISLILALPRPQTLKKVLELAATFGLRRLMLINASRVEKSFFGSNLLKDENILRHLRLGLEQSGNTFLPEVSLDRSFPQFLNRLDRGTKRSLRLLADPEATETLWKSPLAKKRKFGEIVCAVGPEGGWTDEERKGFAKHDFQPVRLDSPIFRVETAVTALLAQIRLMEARFGAYTP